MALLAPLCSHHVEAQTGENQHINLEEDQGEQQLQKRLQSLQMQPHSAQVAGEQWTTWAESVLYLKTETALPPIPQDLSYLPKSKVVTLQALPRTKVAVNQ